MKSGKLIRRFSLADKREAILRASKWEDLDDYLELINSLVEEVAGGLRTEVISREEEIEFLSRVLSRLEKDEVLYLVAEGWL